jgi:hypothetical protein
MRSVAKGHGTKSLRDSLLRRTGLRDVAERDRDRR